MKVKRRRGKRAISFVPNNLPLEDYKLCFVDYNDEVIDEWIIHVKRIQEALDDYSLGFRLVLYRGYFRCTIPLEVLEDRGLVTRVDVDPAGRPAGGGT